MMNGAMNTYDVPLQARMDRIERIVEEAARLLIPHKQQMNHMPPDLQKKIVDKALHVAARLCA